MYGAGLRTKPGRSCAFITAGLPCDLAELQTIADEYGLKLIEDAAHALGATYRDQSIGQISDFTMFSFAAVKNITTGDGGMLIMRDASLLDKARRLRSAGIDRKAKQAGNWENDIFEIGYRYQTSDIAAAIGLAALDEFDEVLAHRRGLLEQYERELANIPGLSLIGARRQDRTHAAWMCTILAEAPRGPTKEDFANKTSSQARFIIEMIDILFSAGAGMIFRIWTRWKISICICRSTRG